MNNPMPMPYGYPMSHPQNSLPSGNQLPFLKENNESLQYQINELKQKIRILEQKMESFEKQTTDFKTLPYQSSMYMM